MATTGLEISKVAIVGAGVMGEAMIHALNRLGLIAQKSQLRKNVQSEKASLLRSMALKTVL